VIIKNILQVLRELNKQKLRTALTLFGIFWGTTSVILLLTFGFAVKANTSKSMHGMGESICVIWAGRTSISYGGFPKGRSLNFFNGDAKYLKENVSLIGDLSPQYSRQLSANVNGKKQSYRVHGVWPEFQDMRNMVPQAGSRFINPIDMEERRRVCFIGFGVQETMFGKKESVGQIIYLNGTPFTVIGILKEKMLSSQVE